MNLSEQLESLSFHETESRSMLIDFGGISCYQCNINIMKDKKKFKLQRIFDSWKDVIYRKSERYARDAENILKFDYFVFGIYFERWKNSYHDALIEKQRQAFKIWKIMTYTRIKERDNLRQKAIEAVIYWKNVSLRRVLIYHSNRRLRKKYFIIWAKFFKNQQKLFKIKQRVDKVKLKQFMRIWKKRYRVHKNKTAEQKLNDKYYNQKVEIMFDYWRVLYAKKLLKIPVQSQIKRTVFMTWKNNLQKSLILRQCFAKVAQKRNNYLKFRAFSRLIHKYKLSQRKRKRRLENMWARIVIHEITYSRVRYLHAKILKNAAFRQMKIKYQLKTNDVKQEFFNIWLRYVKLQKNKRECQQVRTYFALSRYFGRWQITFRRIKEEQEVRYVASRVVYTHLKQRAFMTWLIRAKENMKKRKVIALRFRKKHIMMKCFNYWHNYSIMINTRAEEYYKTISLKKFFNAFVHVTLEIPNNKEQKAVTFYNRNLKKKYFNRLKSYIKCDIEDDENINELIYLLNGRCSNLF